MSEQQALKMVTLNPAKLLHLDHRLGSIKIGKDADLVLWSDNPLSIYAKVEKTMVDGIIYFDRAQDVQRTKAMGIERNRLIQKLMKVKPEDKAAGKGSSKIKKYWQCTSFNGYEYLHNQTQY